MKKNWYQTSVIFVAWINTDTQPDAIGFAQLYSTFCSVEASSIWVLYDLFVVEQMRDAGVGRALMNQAQKMAKKTGASRIDLETAHDNINAQGLYESLGYERDNGFYKYSLEL